MFFCFFRQVIPTPERGKDAARVRVNVGGIIEGERVEVGSLEFPSKASWTKFYGSISKGALAITDMEIKMENVPYEGKEMPKSEELGDLGASGGESQVVDSGATKKFPDFGQPSKSDPKG